MRPTVVLQKNSSKWASIAVSTLTLLISTAMPFLVGAQDDVVKASDTTCVQRDLPEVIRIA